MQGYAQGGDHGITVFCFCIKTHSLVNGSHPVIKSRLDVYQVESTVTRPDQPKSKMNKLTIFEMRWRADEMSLGSHAKEARFSFEHDAINLLPFFDHCHTAKARGSELKNFDLLPHFVIDMCNQGGCRLRSLFSITDEIGRTPVEPPQPPCSPC